MKNRTETEIKTEAATISGQLAMYRAELNALEKKGRNLYDDNDKQILGIRRKMAFLRIQQRNLGEELNRRPQDNRVADSANRRDQ